MKDAEKFTCAMETAIPVKPRCRNQCESCKIWANQHQLAEQSATLPFEQAGRISGHPAKS